MPSSRDPPDPGIKPRSPTLQVDSLPSEPPGKLQNTGVGSLSLLQGIFSIQELNQDLLHFRLILYQLSYQGSPKISLLRTKKKKERKRNRKISLTFFLFLCLVLAESCPALPFPRGPDVAFPECCEPADGPVGVGGGVFSGESGQGFMQDPCSKRCGSEIRQPELLLTFYLVSS